MRKYLIVVVYMIAAVAGSSVMAQSQTGGFLSMLPADSVVLYDFFWSGEQRAADYIMGDVERAWPWHSPVFDADALTNRSAIWERTVENMRLEGVLADSADTVDSLLPLLKESVELGLLTGEARFFDVAERMLANSVMRCWRLQRASKLKYEPLAQIMRSVGSMAYAMCGRDIYINMLVRSNVHVHNEAVDFCMQVFNSSPWYNDTRIRIVKDMNSIEEVVDTVLLSSHRLIVREQATDSVDLTFHLRVPSWVSGQNILQRYTANCKKLPVVIMVNGVRYRPEVQSGYAVIRGRWAVGDIISIKMPTPILRVYKEDQPDVVALQRGPLVYCHGNYARGWSFDVESPVKADFNQGKEAIILNGELENEYGRKPFIAMPYYLVGEKTQIFLPAK